MTACPVCACAETVSLEYRANAPIMMHRLYATREEARACKRGVLDIRRCNACGFAWNAAFDPALVEYDDVYENDQMNSDVFAEHVRERAKDVIAAAPDGLDYLEVGCGQGQFIDMVADMAGGQLRSAEGFDPAFRGGDGARANIHKVYFTPATAKLLTRAPNVVASRHTIEHVQDPVAFLRAIRAALGDIEATIFIETPCIDWIIDNDAMQDFFYEHCAIFNAHSLGLALAMAGFADAHVAHCFGGQYLWGKASITNAHVVPAQAETRSAAKGWMPGSAGMRSSSAFEPKPSAFTARWRAEVEAARREGSVALWGAGAKGVTFALLIDPDGALIDSVIDINPRKRGLYLAVTGLPVVAPEGAVSRAPKTIFVMNPNYLAEIRAQAAALGVNARFVGVE